MSHLLVTNDFPPKVGGIQAYLYELWRRLEPRRFEVLTSTTGRDDQAFDRAAAAEGMVIHRRAEGLLLPTPDLRAQVASLARRLGASLVVLDPALPLGLLGPSLPLPYGVVLHGAEVTVPGRVPGARWLLTRVLRHASLVVAAGGYPAAEGERAAGGDLPPTVVVPPGVDTTFFRPLGATERTEARVALSLSPQDLVVSSVSRLVPRKGMDRLVSASAALAPSFPQLRVLIAGEGRDRSRLEQRSVDEGAPVRFLGAISEGDKASLLGSSDLFVMACRSRWGGLEQEGFGIVFLEAAAAGVPQVAGRSGGAHEAVDHGETGLVVDQPTDAGAVAGAMRRLLADPALRASMGRAARRRAEESFAYDLLAPRLARALAEVGG